jgi:GNAT superfamily N-acetyltransferase
LPAWNSTEYAKRLAAQERGELVQVVAWMDERPVGKAMVLFPGYEEYSESAEREGCAEIRDVGVVEGVRRRGVGTALIRELERTALMHGMTTVGMSVAIGVDAGPGELLYAKLGYVVAHGPFITSTDLYDDDERPIPVGAVMCYLTKSLLEVEPSLPT